MRDARQRVYREVSYCRTRASQRFSTRRLGPNAGAPRMSMRAAVALMQGTGRNAYRESRG
jgi:hypothetical protein